MDHKPPELPELPAGIHTFEQVRDRQAVYVDKTKFFPLLPKGRKVVFCARPRRFGKSLTVSALDAFFSGRKELFQGLTALEFMDSPEFAPKPVIHLDMSRVATSEGLQVLKERLRLRLESIAKRHNVSTRGSDPGSAFSCLIEDIRDAVSQRVILLIDEYDFPVISLIQKDAMTYDSKLVEQTRDFMREFYTLIKANDEYIDFVFITGISKFSRMGVFSTLNNLVDISLKPEFAAFMGLTQEELEVNFAPHLIATAKQLRSDEKELLEQIRNYYDGFSFDGTTRVYNPFSTLLFFGDREFKKYWPLSGSNTFIRKFLKDQELTVEQFSGIAIDRDFADSPGEIGATTPEGFLYQAGYLTLRKDSQGAYTLDYPNFEVRAALSALFMDNLYSSQTQARTARLELGQHLAAGDVHNMLAVFWRLYAGLSYLDHTDAISQRLIKRVLGGFFRLFGKKLQDLADLNPEEKYLKDMRQKLGESFYRSALQSCLWGAEALVRPEAHNNKGRSDLEVRYNGRVYIIEMKTAQSKSAALKAAHDGMAQILKRDYGGAHKNPILISLAVDLKERNIGACVFIKNGETTVLESRDLLILAHQPDMESDQIPTST
jgi:hypothetical protein